MKNNEIKLDDHKGEVPVLITFAYHFENEDNGDEYDGEETKSFRVTEEEYEKIQDYYAHPWAHYIGVMINHEMPRINKMVEEAAPENVYHIFILQIELDDRDDDECDDENCEQDESNDAGTRYVDEDLPF